MLTPRRQLFLGTAAFFVLRLALTIPRTGPVVVADEIGYLANARVLAGGVDGQLSSAPFYHGGYSLLLAPLLAVVHNPSTSYRLVLVLNAALAASLAPLLYLLLTRTFSIGRRAAVWPALAAAAYPSVTIYTQVAMSENLLLPLLVLWLLCVGSLLQSETVRRQVALAAATAVCAVWLWAAHGRMIVAAALTVALFGLMLWRRAWQPAIAGLAVIAVGLVAVHLLDHFLVMRNWDGHATNEVSGRLSTVESAGGLGAFFRNLVGQSWYLAVASLGVLLAAALPFGPRSLRVRFTSPHIVLALMLLSGVGLLVESALSFRTTDRPDMLVYGRYTDIVLPPLLALALVRLNAGRRVRLGLVVAVLAVLTAAAVLLRTSVHPSGLANRWNVASLPAPTFQLGPKVLLLAGAVSIAAIVAVTLARRRAPAVVGPLVLVLFLPTTAVIERNPVLTAQSAFYPSGWTSPAEAVGHARTVGFDVDHGGSLFVYQWFASKARFVTFRGTSGRPPARVVFSSPGWAARHAVLRPKALWSDPGRDGELYRLERVG